MTIRRHEALALHKISRTTSWKKASDGFRGVKDDPITSSNGEGPQGFSNRQWRLQGG